MRVLVLQNLYPPLGHGGYAEVCAAAVRGLQARGHEVLVLTSNYGLTTSVESQSNDVLRLLEPNAWFLFHSRGSLVRREWHNQRVLKKALGRFRPDLAFVLAMDGLSASLVSSCFAVGLPVVFNIHSWWLRDIRHDPWTVFWNNSPRSAWRRQVKKIMNARGLSHLVSHLIAPVNLGNWSLEHCMFPSQFRKQEYLDAGLPVSQGVVIYSSVDTELFHPAQHRKIDDGKLQLLFAGLWDEAKGVMSAIKAISLLDTDTRKHVSLSLVGSAADPDYERTLREFVSDNNLANSIIFAGRVTHQQMAVIYAEHDVLIFPSIVPEGLPLTLLESMASGMTVISTATGGSQEVVLNEHNALVVPPGDSQAIANAIRRLLHEPELRVKLAQNGLSTVQERFCDDAIQDQIEAYLLQVVVHSPAANSQRLECYRE